MVIITAKDEVAAAQLLSGIQKIRTEVVCPNLQPSGPAHQPGYAYVMQYPGDSMVGHEDMLQCLVVVQSPILASKHWVEVHDILQLTCMLLTQEMSRLPEAKRATVLAYIRAMQPVVNCTHKHPPGGQGIRVRRQPCICHPPDHLRRHV
jgi:hypothetical protein